MFNTEVSEISNRKRKNFMLGAFIVILGVLVIIGAVLMVDVGKGVMPEGFVLSENSLSKSNAQVLTNLESGSVIYGISSYDDQYLIFAYYHPNDNNDSKCLIQVYSPKDGRYVKTVKSQDQCAVNQTLGRLVVYENLEIFFDGVVVNDT